MSSPFKFTDRRHGKGVVIGTSAQNEPQPSKAEVGQRMAAVQGMAGRRKTAATGTSGSSFQIASGRPKDPMFYWRQNNIPFDFNKPEEMAKIREFARLLYITHPVIAACIDVYSKLPLQGLHFECKDDQVKDFYEELFINRLNYEDHLLKMGRQYWIQGEAWSLGGWNETLGIWEGEQIIDPVNIEIEKTMFLTNEPRFLMKLPESLREVLTSRSPRREYDTLVRDFPELLDYLGEENQIPVSNIILKQLKFEADDFTDRGIPILMRAFRAIVQEEMLNSALDSMADRLYTPLTIVKLGAKASDLGTTSPWIPTADEREEMAAAWDSALAGDFRVLFTHFATEVEQVYGKDQIPDLGNDFDRILERQLLAFGLSQTMLTGASAGETYAADALNRDVVTQLLTHYQRLLRNFTYDRAEVVAEAQGHYDYEVRNGDRFLITEEIYEVDEETGEERVYQQPKLLVPTLAFSTLNLTDQETERQFIEQIRSTGVPVSMKTRTGSTEISVNDEIELSKSERVDLAIAEQETRKSTYMALKAAGLPISQDLRDDFDPHAIPVDGSNVPIPGGDQPIPGLGSELDQYPALAPGENETSMMSDAENSIQNDVNNAELPQEGDDVPEESNEEKADMPKSAKLRFLGKLNKISSVREVTRERYVPVDNSEESNPRHYTPSGLFGNPPHVGMRKYVFPDGQVPEELRLPKEE